MARVGVLNDGRRIRGEDILVVADAQDQRAAPLGPDERIGEIAAKDGQAECPVELLQGLLNGPLEPVLPVRLAAPVVVGVEVPDQVRDHLRVRLTDEGDPLAAQPGLQGAVVLDDPVVNDGDLARVVEVGVGVDRIRLAVGRPARVADAQHVTSPRLVENLLQGADAAVGLLDAKRPIGQKSHAR